jgi:molybdate transport system regulatory protein
MSSLTTRNQLRGTVTNVVLGSVMAEVTVDVSGDEFTAVITRHSAERLSLAEGDEVTVLVKATEVMLAKGSLGDAQLSTRNQIRGKVARIGMGSVMGEAVIDIGDGGEIVAAVTRHSMERLGLAEGDDVVVLVKATEVMLSKD